MPSDLPTEQCPMQGAAIEIKSLCATHYIYKKKTYSETLNCDASVEMQEANNGTWASWLGKACGFCYSCRIWTIGRAWSRVFGDLLQHRGLPGREFRWGRRGWGNPLFLGWRSLVSDQAVTSEAPSTFLGWSLIGSRLFQSPTCPVVFLSVRHCLALCPDQQTCSVSFYFYFIFYFFACISLLLGSFILYWRNVTTCLSGFQELSIQVKRKLWPHSCPLPTARLSVVAAGWNALWGSRLATLPLVTWWPK